MSRLDELMRELCTDGVEFFEVGELCKTQTPKIKIKSNDYSVEGTYPIIDQGQAYIGGYTNEKGAFPKGEYVIFGDHTCVVKYVNFEFVQGADGVKVLMAYDNIIIPKYLYYCMSNIRLDSTYTRHWSKMKAQCIPVPPLEVQREIVRILDNFTELTGGLTTVLTMELAARQRQYKFYRDKLLTFGADIPHKTMDALCNVYAGGDAPRGNMKKTRTDEYSVPIISNGVGENAFYGFTTTPKITIPAVTIAARGTIGYAEYRDYPYYPIIRLLSVIPKDTSVLNTRYLYYCLQGKEYNIPTSGIPQLTSPMLKKVEIPVPDLDVQERTVNILDRLDALCNDITKGIPAEIAARKMQYEFYRDKLLTFESRCL